MVPLTNIADQKLKWRSIESKREFFARASKLALIHMPPYKLCWYMQG